MSITRHITRAARRLAAKLANEGGAGLSWFVLFMGVVGVGGAASIDFGSLVVERREQQKSADSMVLAGVAELPDDPGAAEDFARAWATRNGVDTSSEIVNLVVDNSCWSDHPADNPDIDDSIMADISRPARLLFFRELGVSMDVGAHAKACVGSLRASDGLRPWSISILNSPCFELGAGGDPDDVYDYAPLYGERCVIRLESPSSQVGSIRLGDEPGDECAENGGGASKYVENIVEGSGATCEIGEVIDTEPGLQVGPTFDALITLLATEGACDTAFGQGNGYDELTEVFSSNPPGAAPSPTTLFIPRDCGWDGDADTPDSPRFVSLVLIDEFDKPTGMGSEPIIGFAGFFIESCEVLNGAGAVTATYPRCNVPPGQRSRVQLVGTFIQHLRLGGPGGPLDPFGTRILALVE